MKVALLLLLLKVYIGECSLDSCPVKLEPIGCYADAYYDRALTTEVLNARDPSRDIYAGYSVPWHDWKNYLPKFICDCAKVAFKKGYRVMGIQFYAECWGSLRGHLEYAKHGESNHCVHDGMHEPWGKCNSGSDITCSGEALTNYVYRIAPSGCDTYYEPVGCFKDNQIVPRPIPDYVMNERDYTISNWNGRLIDWRNWNTYSPQMICRCAKKAKDLGHTTFSVQFYGECWTGPESKIHYQRDGISKRCLAKDFLDCPYKSYHCVGMDQANYVYRLKTGKATSEVDSIRN